MNRKKFLCSKLFNIVLSEIREELETFTDQKIFFCSVNGCNFLCFFEKYSPIHGKYFRLWKILFFCESSQNPPHQ